MEKDKLSKKIERKNIETVKMEYGIDKHKLLWYWMASKEVEKNCLY